MCYLFMPKNLGLDAVLSRRRGELEKARRLQHRDQPGGVSADRKKIEEGAVGTRGKPEAHTCMLRLLEGPSIPGTGAPGGGAWWAATTGSHRVGHD